MFGRRLVAVCLVLLGSTGHALAQMEAPRVEVAPGAEPVAREAFGERDEVAVVLRLTVGEDGAVREAEIVEPAGAPFDAAARAALLDARFAPARRDGEPVAARIAYRFVFRRPPPPEPEIEPEVESATEPEATPEPPPEAEETELGVTAQVEVEPETARERSAEAVDVVDTGAQRHRARDLGDALAREPGVSVRRSGAVGAPSTIALAGLEGDQVRVFLDGVPLEVAGFPFGLANVPIALVDRVEVYRGVVPIRFGADALGGAIDLVTSDRFARTFALGSYQVGSFGTYRGSLVARTHDPGSGFTAGVTAFADHADNDYPIDVELADARGRLSPARVRRFHDAYDALGLSVDAGFVDRPWARRLTVRAFGSGYDKELQHDRAMTRPYGDVEYGERVYGGSLVYEVDDLFGEDAALSLVSGLSHRQIDFLDVGERIVDWRGETLRARRSPGEIDGQASDRSFWQWSSYTRLYARWAPAPDHELRVSFSPTFDTRTGEERRADPALRDPLGAERELFRAVSGLSYRLRLFGDVVENVVFAKHYFFSISAEEALPANVYRRLDQALHHAGFGDALRVHATEWLWIKASYEYATRLPNAAEVFGDGALVGPNLELRPEIGHNVNVGAQLDHREAGSGRWRAEATFFLRLVDDFITPLGVETLSYENIREVPTVGGAASVGWESPGRYVSVRVDGTLQDQRSQASEGPFARFQGDRIPNRPWAFANARAALRWPSLLTGGDAIRLEWDLRYVHEFFRGWESQGARDSKDVIPSQLVTGLALSYRLPRPVAITTTFEVQNLTDERVYDLFGVQRPGRSFFLKLTAEL